MVSVLFWIEIEIARFLSASPYQHSNVRHCRPYFLATLNSRSTFYNARQGQQGRTRTSHEVTLVSTARFDRILRELSWIFFWHGPFHHPVKSITCVFVRCLPPSLLETPEMSQVSCFQAKPLPFALILNFNGIATVDLLRVPRIKKGVKDHGVCACRGLLLQCPFVYRGTTWMKSSSVKGTWRTFGFEPIWIVHHRALLLFCAMRWWHGKSKCHWQLFLIGSLRGICI